jgi:hypothetical protein
MKNIWKGAIALMLFGITTALTSAGCVQAEAPFFIHSAKAIACDEVTVDSAELPYGVMDVRYSCNYSAILRLGNQLVRRGDETKLQIETSRISVTAFDVEILDAGGQQIDNGGAAAAFTYPTTGFIDPSNQSQPGYGLAGALLVDGATAQTLAGQGGGSIIARIVAHGRTLGGDDITSRPFDFPIQVCVGCLCRTPSDDTCVNSIGQPMGTCFIPQDQPFDCRFLGGHECTEEATCGVFE